jgi:hypothetical protein
MPVPLCEQVQQSTLDNMAALLLLLSLLPLCNVRTGMVCFCFDYAAGLSFLPRATVVLIS